MGGGGRRGSRDRVLLQRLEHGHARGPRSGLPRLNTLGNDYCVRWSTSKAANRRRSPAVHWSLGTARRARRTLSGIARGGRWQPDAEAWAMATLGDRGARTGASKQTARNSPRAPSPPVCARLLPPLVRTLGIGFVPFLKKNCTFAKLYVRRAHRRPRRRAARASSRARAPVRAARALLAWCCQQSTAPG